jgi:2-amino-4-hydroxy-6-hydroxymethyldihydropteridine diphosphokinase
MVKDRDKRNLVYLSIGTNLGNRKLNMEEAIHFISIFSEIEKVSSIFETEAWGKKELLPFFNMVISISTSMLPDELLKACQEIESKLGRVKGDKDTYENRIIDIDILFYNNDIIQKKGLIVPHPLLHERLFVIEPFIEIAPRFIHPLLKQSMLELSRTCEDESEIQKLS